MDSKHDSVRTQSKMTSFLVPKKKLNANDSQEFMSALTYFCARDIGPYSSVEGPGFKKVLQSCVSIGSKYGNISVDDILPCRTTVAEHCHAEVIGSRKMLVDSINKFAVSHGMIGVTTDMWTDPYKKNFVAVTVHMLMNGEMITRTLQVDELCIIFSVLQLIT